MNYNVMHSDDNFMYVIIIQENKSVFVFLLIIGLLYFVLI